MKTIVQHFPGGAGLLFIKLCKVFPTFEPVDKILNFNHTNERYLTVLYYGAACFAIFTHRKLEIKSLVFLTSARICRVEFLSLRVALCGSLLTVSKSTVIPKGMAISSVRA